ncbi:MAG: hypothetical protein HYV16_13320 [Gammaproteobacteria bacterium]|nr:hypothetical protein [Gammaproteobacteria bacterium]
MRFSVTHVSLSLAGLGAVLAAGLYWSLNRVDEPFRLNQQYYALQSQVSIDTRQAIGAYLETGDAMRLLEAEHSVRDAIGDLRGLPPELAQGVAPQLEVLLDKLTGDFTAAGKLAGDPQGLLINAERELGDALASLVDYARDGYARNPRAAFDYGQRIQGLNAELRQLAHARQRYFASRNPAFKKSLDERVLRMQTQAQALASLPLLGVMTQSDPDALVANAPEDQRIALLAELNSLLRRYPDELERTHGLIARGLASREKVQELVTGLENQLSRSETELRQSQNEITESITIGGIAFVLSLWAAAALLPSFRRPVAA